MDAKKAHQVVTAIVFLAAIAIVAGFWFHTSIDDDPVLGKYSLRYFVGVSAITVISFSALLFFHILYSRQREAGPGPGGCRSSGYAKLAVLALATALTLVPAEILSANLYRKILKERRSDALFHPFLQAVPKPGDSETGINRWGFRGEEIDLQKPPQTYRIFFLGGSAVYAKQVDFEASHPRLLEKRLREAHPNVRIEIQDAGMEWFTSQHSLIRFLSRVQDFDPDLIIVYHAINDLYRSFSPPRFARGDYEIDYGHFLGPSARMVEAYFEVKPQPRFYLSRIVQEVLGPYWYSDFARQSKLPEVQIFDWPSLSQFQRNMEDLVFLVKSKNIEVLVASQPFLYKSQMTELEEGALWYPEGLCNDGSNKPDVESMKRGMIAFNNASRSIAEKAKVGFVDLEREIPKTLEYFLDDVHYTEKGNSAVGDAFADAIMDKKLIAERFPQTH